MEEERAVEFPLTARLYAWAFVIAASLAPLALPLHELRHDPGASQLDWSLILPAIVGLQLLFVYVQWRCSSASLSFWQGLYYVACAMGTGWWYFSVLIIFPAMALMSVAALVLALYADIRRQPQLAPRYFHRLVRFFYRNRMVQ